MADSINDTIKFPIGKVFAICALLAILIPACFWLFNVSAQAQRADQQSQQNAVDIQKKADREDLREIKSDIKEIRDFLLNGKGR